MRSVDFELLDAEKVPLTLQFLRKRDDLAPVSIPLYKLISLLECPEIVKYNLSFFSWESDPLISLEFISSGIHATLIVFIDQNLLSSKKNTTVSQFPVSEILSDWH